MAGASNTSRQDAYILEVTPGTTPATPGFTKTSFQTLNMTANPRLSENFPSFAGGQRSGTGRNGIAVAGSAGGNLIYGEYDDFFASLFQANWTTNVLINANDQIAMTIEQAAPQGVGGALLYNRFRGVEVVTGQLRLAAGQNASVSFDLLGSGSDDAATSIIAGATYADPTNTAVLGSGSDVTSISMTGLEPLDCAENLTIDFGVADKTEQPRIASDDACGINRGAMRPTISGDFYVEDNFVAIYNAARAGTPFALTVALGTVTTEKYTIEFPTCQFVEANMQTAESGPLLQRFNILPEYDSGIGGTCRITRAIV